MRCHYRVLSKILPLAFAACASVLPTDGFGIDKSQLPPVASKKVDFVKDVQPIFEKSCSACHGEKLQKGDLRLDVKQLAFKGSAHGAVFKPGNSADSLLIHLVAGLDPEMVMPQKGDRLTSEQIGILRAWIDQGAVWPDGVDKAKFKDPREHWAFKAPVRPAAPKVKDGKWVRNPIDAYVLARLEKEKLRPSSEADKTTLIRRLSLDLIGLPPSLEEIDQFLSDQSPDAYEKLVDRLLSSPHYGERQGRHWLDAARYADTNGYEKDLPRIVWPYRDWVINALNKDLPFDQFTIEQIAGDLLPNATRDNRVATGFLRNSMLNEEGGIDPEQFRVEGVIDRVDTIGKSFLGLTVACAQCHNHKYDPISHKEYYQIFAFLNNDNEPELEVQGPEQLKEQAKIRKAIEKIEDDLIAQNADLGERMKPWEQKMREINFQWEVLDPDAFYGAVGTKFIKQNDKSLLALGSSPPISGYTFVAKTQSTNITGVRLEAIADPNLPNDGPGRADNGNFVLTEIALEVTPLNDLSKTNKVTFTNATADFSQPAFHVSNAIDGTNNNKMGWAGEDLPGRRNRNRTAVFETGESFGFDGGTVLKFDLKQVFGGQHTLGRFRLSVLTEKRNLQADPLSEAQRAVLAIAPEGRSKEQQRALFSVYRLGDERFAEGNKKIDEEQKKWPGGPRTLVLAKANEPRETHIFKRGDFRKPAELVTPGVPAVLHPLKAEGTPTRLDFAKWLADKRNPMIARVTVNRMWQNYFGEGLVTTPEDFGTRAELASHPELLDFLATEFMAREWSLKAIHRLIVTSATYRQSSKVSPKLYELDQYNRLLARAPRIRVEAEIIRDIGLKTSGLLNTKVGGPSVYPTLPDGALTLAYGNPKWPTSEGAERYRRAMYTYWKRTAPYPSMTIFDAPTADVSCVRRVRSNTPLQALTTLNDAVYYEIAQAMALRVYKEGGTDDAARAQFAFRLCTGRTADDFELKEILALLENEKSYFEDRTDKAITVALADPKNLPADVNLHKVAAWTMVSRVLLNMDTTITKE